MCGIINHLVNRETQSFYDFSLPASEGNHPYKKGGEYIMNIKNAITMAVSALTVLTASAAMADKIGSVSTATPETVVFTTSGSGGTADSLKVTYADGAWSPSAGHGGPTTITPVKFSLSALGGSSSSLGGSDLLETFTGGTFSITDGSTNYLSGTFTGGKLTTFNNSLGVTSATYDLSSTSLGADGPIGAFSLEFNFDPGQGYDTSGGYLHSFSASDSATFSGVPARAVPEPATVAPFIMGGLGLMGLAFRARKTRRSNGAAA